VTAQRPLRIGLNLLYLMEGAGGAGRYAEELIPALLEAEPDTALTAFVTTRMQEELLQEPWAAEVEWVRYDIEPGSRRALLAQMVELPIASARRRHDVLHSPANFGILKTLRAANVVTLLDLIWLHPETSPHEPGERARGKLVFTRCARAADRILTISEATKQDLIETIGLRPDRIDVTPLGARADGARPTPEAELRTRLGLGRGRFLLSVAQKQPHKNLSSLIRALAKLDDDVELVLAGASAPHEAELRALADRLELADRVRFLAWVTNADLAGLYEAAAGFVLPSFLEGFGLPVLEAMQHGTPVACSNRSALPEVAGDAALLFDPYDQESVTGAIRRLLGDEKLRADLVRRGYEQAGRFTWEQTAAGTLAGYRRAISVRQSA
jgi:glycosyltransferase involved in cell wall biosynthesis